MNHHGVPAFFTAIFKAIIRLLPIGKNTHPNCKAVWLGALPQKTLEISSLFLDQLSFFVNALSSGLTLFLNKLLGAHAIESA